MSHWYTEPGKEPDGLTDDIHELVEKSSFVDVLGAFIHYLEDCDNDLGRMDNEGETCRILAEKLRSCLDYDLDFPEEEA